LGQEYFIIFFFLEKNISKYSFPKKRIFRNILFLEKNISKYSFPKKRIFRNILFSRKECFGIFFLWEKNISNYYLNIVFMAKE